jgi:radical SAM protein with 4Fe4S-binding SPASM domain
MDWSMIEKIARESASAPLLSAIIYELHNEPLLDKRIFDCVRYFTSLNKDKRCIVVTNGELIDEFAQEDIGQSGLHRLIVSLNAHSEHTYMKLNTRLHFDRVTKNVSSLLSNVSTAEKLVLSFVITKQNEQEVCEALKYWKKRGVHTKVIGLVNRGGFLADYGSLWVWPWRYTGTFPLRLWRHFMTWIRNITGCYHPFYKMTILFNGDVILCCHDWNRAIVIGNIKENSLQEIWNCDRMNEIRRLILHKRYQEIESCTGCSLASR